MWQQDRVNGLTKTTRLSEREAELYLLKTWEGKTLDQAATEMGIETNTAKGKWGRIKKKIREAEATATLTPGGSQ